jgi:hypothetical protein
MGFLDGDPSEAEDPIIDSFSRLRARLIPELTTFQITHTPQMLWKIASLYQCLIRRTIEAAEGMRSAWVSDNLLTTITMARSLLETGAIVRHLTDSVKKATLNRDVEALDDAVMNVSFADRLGWLKEEGADYKATSVLTMIERLDKSLFEDKIPRLRQTYDFLSEFVHPNHLGILQLYSTTFSSEHRLEYGDVARKKVMILPNLRITLSMIWLVETAVKRPGYAYSRD